MIRVWTEAEMESSEAGRLGTDLLRQFTATFSDRLNELEGDGADHEVTALALVAMVERLNTSCSQAGWTRPVRPCWTRSPRSRMPSSAWDDNLASRVVSRPT